MWTGVDQAGSSAHSRCNCREWCHFTLLCGPTVQLSNTIYCEWREDLLYKMRSSAGWCQGIRLARQLSIPLRAFHYPPTRRPLSCKTPFALNPWIIPIAFVGMATTCRRIPFLLQKPIDSVFCSHLSPCPAIYGPTSPMLLTTWLDKISVEKQVGWMWFWYFRGVCPFKCVRFERPWLRWSGWGDWEGLSNRGQSKMAQSVRARVMHCHTPDTSLTPWFYWCIRADLLYTKLSRKFDLMRRNNQFFRIRC